MNSRAVQRDRLQLNSWKEIAAYMGRSVRGVQRLEKLGLPIRRLSLSWKASVSADSRDIDKWLASARAHGIANPQSAEHIFLRASLRDALNVSRGLQAEMVQLREERRQDMKILAHTIEQLIETVKANEVPLPEPRQASSKYQN